jgi:hypothetical protein
MLCFAHGNRKGTGAMLEVDIVPSSGTKSGGALLVLTPQSNDETSTTWADKGPLFDRRDSAQACIPAEKVGHVVAVLRGDCRSILGDKGLRLRDEQLGEESVVYIDNVAKPKAGTNVHIVQTTSEGRSINMRIWLNESEAMAVRMALESAMAIMSFAPESN